jgi:hypothetical protein
MTGTILMTDEQLISQAVETLMDKLGILEATRFLAFKSEEKSDYVKWHQEWQAQLDKEAFFDEVFK